MPEETVLIRPLPVERDVDGWWSHPDYLSEYDDEITEAQFMEWCLRNQVETKITYMESDVSIDVFDAYMDDRRCSGISESRRLPLYKVKGQRFTCHRLAWLLGYSAVSVPGYPAESGQ
ncbi:hypothetical protein [Pseudomonas sp. NPDC086278]|uniref:hypothetical protein n=1 Tax=Pseudomonas sp. NPDC086278 TaxID=3390646 RepID=UPI003CFFC27C